jgi:chromosome segregation ATPase
MAHLWRREQGKSYSSQGAVNAMLSDKVLDLIGIAIGALGVGIGSGVTAFFLWLTNHNKSKAEAKKALAEADAEKIDADADSKKTAAETSQIATETALTSMLQSNQWLAGRLAKLDEENVDLRKRIDELEKRLNESESARDTLQRKYDNLKKWVVETLDILVADLEHCEDTMIDKAKVIKKIRDRLSTLPGTGPFKATQ